MGNIYTKDNTGSNILYSTGVVSKPTIVYNYPTLSITVGFGTYRTANTPDFTGKVYEFSLPEKTMVVEDGTKYYVSVSYNDDNPIMYLETDISLTNDSNIVPIFTIFIDGEDIDVLDWGFEANFLANRLNERFVDTQRYGRVSGLELYTSNNSIASSGGSFYLGSNKISYEQTSSLIDDCELLVKDTPSGWIKSAITVYPNTKYDDGSGILADLTDGQYGVVWVWRSAGDPLETYVSMGNGSYVSIESAKNDKIPSDLLEKVTEGAFLIGRAIFLKGATTDIVESAFDTIFSANLPTIHNSLINLQGGNTDEFYHLSQAKYDVVQNTSGINTGDETTGDLIPASNKVIVTGGTDAIIGAETTVDIDPTNILHNDLSTKQGGTIDEYYHITATELANYNKAVSVLSNISKAIMYQTTPHQQTLTASAGYLKLVIPFVVEVVEHGFSLNAPSARIEYTGATKRILFNSTATIALGNTNNTAVSFKVYKNGTIALDNTFSQVALDTSVSRSTLNAATSFLINNGDFLEVFISADKNITLTVLGMQLQLVEEIGYTFNT